MNLKLVLIVFVSCLIPVFKGQYDYGHSSGAYDQGLPYDQEQSGGLPVEPIVQGGEEEVEQIEPLDYLKKGRQGGQGPKGQAGPPGEQGGQGRQGGKGRQGGQGRQGPAGRQGEQGRQG